MFLRPVHTRQERSAGTAIAILGLLLMGLGCSDPLPPHVAIGKWQGTLTTIVLYEDGLATFNSLRCQWEPVDDWTVRLVPSPELEGEGPLSLMSDFRVLPESGGDRAVVNLGFFDVQLQRVGGAA